MIVILNRADVLIATALGQMRHDVAVSAGYYRQLGATPEDDIAADREGIMGEIAFGRFADRFVDFSFEARRGGCDFRFNGQRIDVKTTHIEGKALTLDKWKLDRHGYADVDVFVLAEILQETSVFVGDDHRKLDAPPGGKLVDLVGQIGIEAFRKTAKLVKTKWGKEIFLVERDFLSPVAWL